MLLVRCTVLLMMLCAMSAPVIAAAPADLDEFQERAADILEAHRMPGAGIVLVSEGELLWAGGIGRADLEDNRPVLGNTRFRIGSITKMFTALAILRLVDEGRLSLDDRVIDIAPEVPIRNPWRASDPVRVAHLLEHTAGFDDMHFRNMNGDEPPPDSLQEIIAALDHELVVRWRPGEKHAYSNPGYALAGYLVERITGQPFYEYLDNAVLEPLGFEHVAWGAPAEHAASGYSGTPRRKLDHRGIRLYPAGELSASPRDLARLIRFFLQRGALDDVRLLPPDLIARMEAPATTRAARHGLENGYGLGNYVSFRKRFRLHGHNGGLDGFISELAYSSDHGFGYAVLLNRVNPNVLKALSELAVEFLGAQQDVVPVEPGSFDSPAAELPQSLAGCYRMSNPRNELLHGLEWLVQVACVRIEEGQAVFRHPIIPQLSAFVPVSGNLLRAPSEAWPTAVFMSDEGMRDAFEWSGIYFERSNRIAVTLPLVLVIAAQLLIASAFVFLPIWAIRAARGRLRDAPALMTRVWPVLAAASLYFTLFWATRLRLSLLDSVNDVTLGIFIGGVLFLLLSVFALLQVIRNWHAGIHAGVKWHSLLVSLACIGIAAYLVYWQLVPLRLWAW